jgi:chromosome segregation and condensation protein ScpB
MSAPELNLRIVEALLFASPEPVSEEAIAERLPSQTDIAALLAELVSHYDGRGVAPVKIAGRWSFRTAEDLGPRLKIKVKRSRRLSRASLETLAIVAYHQPITRAEIEEVRGVGLSKGTPSAVRALRLLPCWRVSRRPASRRPAWRADPSWLRAWPARASSCARDRSAHWLSQPRGCPPRE